MSTFVLVPPSTQSVRGFDLLTRELASRGHRAIAVELPADKSDDSATEFASVIAGVVPSPDTIVVAHSAAGLFLPLVPERRRVARLVYLMAVIPKIGMSMMDQFRDEPDMFNPDWPGKDPTHDDAIAMQFLFHDCSPEAAAWALRTRRLLYARRAMTEICPLSKWPGVPCSYILCTDDRTISPTWARRVVPERLGIEPIELPGGHCPQVSQPAHLADVLSTIAHT